MANNEADEVAGGDATDIQASDLDEFTHTELCMLYKESADSLRFAKHLQWWTVGSTLVVFFAFIAIADFVGADKTFAKVLTGLVILIAMSAIFALILYQFWQYNELLKIQKIADHMSSLFRDIRKLKSRREANIHRYVILSFMIGSIVWAGCVAFFGIQHIAK